MEKLLAVAIGGGIGAVLRYGVTLLANQHGGILFPYGTVFVNVVGSFLIGFLMMYFNSHMNLPATVKLFIITGILGGFTTFSTFNMELLTFIRANEMALGLLYGGLNVVGAFLFCWLGIVAGVLLY
jgi:fluoride exporter